MDCNFYMYQVFLIPGDFSKKTGWDGNIHKVKENNMNKLVILNRLLDQHYYPPGKERDGERYTIFYPAFSKNIECCSYIHNAVGLYRLDVEEFMNYQDNKNRFYRNKKNGVTYFRGDEPQHEFKNKAWQTSRENSLTNGYLMCCDNLDDFVPLFSSSAGGAKKSRRRIKKIRSRRISRLMYAYK